MALKIIEGFELFNDASEISPGRKFRGSGGEIVPGRLGGNAINHGSESLVLTFDDVTGGTLYIGLALRVVNNMSARGAIFRWGQSGSKTLGLNTNGSGFPEIVKDGLGGTFHPQSLKTSTTTFLNTGIWYYIELEIGVSSTGFINVYVNGELALAWVGDALQGDTGINELSLGSGVSGTFSPTVEFDDIYVVDDTVVPGEPSTRLGDTRVEFLDPGSDVTLTMTATGTTDGFDAVDDSSIDFDVTYVGSATVGDRALFQATGTLSEDPVAIHGVAVTHISKKDGADTRRIDGIIKSGTTETVVQGRTQLDTYSTQEVLIGANPDTGAAFTRAEVEALQFGVEVGQ